MIIWSITLLCYQKSNQVIAEDLKKPEGPLQGRQPLYFPFFPTFSHIIPATICIFRESTRVISRFCKPTIYNTFSYLLILLTDGRRGILCFICVLSGGELKKKPSSLRSLCQLHCQDKGHCIPIHDDLQLYPFKDFIMLHQKELFLRGFHLAPL